ncbi:hypothetical protein BC567DRAFT_97607 [Phyllosticta citribraziliensis]
MTIPLAVYLSSLIAAAQSHVCRSVPLPLLLLDRRLGLRSDGRSRNYACVSRTTETPTDSPKKSPKQRGEGKQINCKRRLRNQKQQLLSASRTTEPPTESTEKSSKNKGGRSQIGCKPRLRNQMQQWLSASRTTEAPTESTKKSHKHKGGRSQISRKQRQRNQKQQWPSASPKPYTAQRRLCLRAFELLFHPPRHGIALYGEGEATGAPLDGIRLRDLAG